MPPKGYSNYQGWIKAEEDKKHSMAVKYIEENVDLIDTDLQKFMDDCPKRCQLKVYEMLLKAGIDIKEYVINSSLKNWSVYFHAANAQFNQYTINYKPKVDEYTSKVIRWETNWKSDCIVFDTIPEVEEV